MAGTVLTAIIIGALAFALVYTFSKTQFWNNARIRVAVVASLITAARVVQLLMGNDVGGDLSVATVPSLQHPYQDPTQSPYGVLWYGMMEGVSFYSYPLGALLGVDKPTSLAIGVLMANIPVLAYLAWRHLNLLPIYAVLIFHSWWPFVVWITDWNLPIAWLAVLGLVNPVFLVLAIIAKLPVGAPVSVWEVALLGKSNKQIATYVPLAVLWIAVIAERRGTLQKMWAMIKRLMAEVWREISTRMKGILGPILTRHSAISKSQDSCRKGQPAGPASSNQRPILNTNERF